MEKPPRKSIPIPYVAFDVYDDSSGDSYDNAEAIAYTYCTGKHVGRRNSVSSKGSKGSRKSSISRKASYYAIQSEQRPQILLAVFVSRGKQYVAGNIFEIDAIPGIEVGGPKRVKVHVRIMPSKRSMIHETD